MAVTRGAQRRRVRRAPRKTRGRTVATTSYVKKLVNRSVEKKYYSAESFSNDVSYDTPLIVSLVEPARGDGDSDRDGDAIKLTSLKLNGTVYNTITDQNQQVRCLIVQWLPTLSGDITSYNVIDPAGAGLDSASYLNQYNHDQRGNFRILYDKLHFLDYAPNVGTPASNVNGGPYVKNFQVYLNLGKLALSGKCKTDMQFVGSASTNANNRLFFLAISDKADASTNEPKISLSWKANFRG